MMYPSAWDSWNKEIKHWPLNCKSYNEYRDQVSDTKVDTSILMNNIKHTACRASSDSTTGISTTSIFCISSSCRPFSSRQLSQAEGQLLSREQTGDLEFNVVFIFTNKFKMLNDFYFWKILNKTFLTSHSLYQTKIKKKHRKANCSLKE